MTDIIFSKDSEMDLIKDPLHEVIRVDPFAVKLIDTALFQRLRRIRQLGLASVVYPSAVHTRFEHALGVYHLASSIVRQMFERGELEGVSDEERVLIPIAALLHDTSHYPAAHFLEEYGLEEADHEKAAEKHFFDGEIADVLATTGIKDVGRKVAELVQHQSDNPLGEIVSGACDADKLDYIARDAYNCGLPMGYDREMLVDSMALLPDPVDGQLRVGIRKRGLGSFEQMLYSKFNLYREVYFHPTVRSATTMMRRLVIEALEAGLTDMAELQMWSDEELFILLQSRVISSRKSPARRKIVKRLVERIVVRRLYKAVESRPLSEAPVVTPDRLVEAERLLAKILGVPEGDALLDIPNRPGMLSTDLLVRFDDGAVRNAKDLGPDEGFAMNAAASALYRASGRVSIFVAEDEGWEKSEVSDALDLVLKEISD